MGHNSRSGHRVDYHRSNMDLRLSDVELPMNEDTTERKAVMQMPDYLKQALHHDQHAMRILEGEYSTIKEVVDKLDAKNKRLESENKRQFDLLRSRNREEVEFNLETAEELESALAERDRQYKTLESLYDLQGKKLADCQARLERAREAVERSDINPIGMMGLFVSVLMSKENKTALDTALAENEEAPGRRLIAIVRTTAMPTEGFGGMRHYQFESGFKLEDPQTPIPFTIIVEVYADSEEK